jgi:hypothetical protein
VHAGEVFKAPADSNYYLPSPYLSRLVQHAADAGVLVSAPPRLFVVPTPKALPRITDSHAPHKRPELVLCH